MSEVQGRMTAEAFRQLVGADRPSALPDQCAWAGLAVPVSEYRFAPPRRWRFDYAWPDAMLAVEIDGGQWLHGRHNRASGVIRDMEKLNLAAALGWCVLRFTPQHVKIGVALNDIQAALAAKGGSPRANETAARPVPHDWRAVPGALPSTRPRRTHPPTARRRHRKGR